MDERHCGTLVYCKDCSKTEGEDAVQHDERLRASEAMRKYGGSFVAALGAALLCADLDNTQRIKSAFPEYWDKYSRLSEDSTGGATDEANVEEYEKDDDGRYRSENGFDQRDHYREM